MKVLVLALIVTAVCAKHEQYIGWKAFYVTPETREQLGLLNDKATELGLDVVSRPAVNRNGVVLVEPEHQVGFEEFLASENIEYRIPEHDLKTQFDFDDRNIEARRIETRSMKAERIPYNNYQELEVIYDYIDKIAEEYPDVATLVTGGESFEGRPLKYLKISNDNFASGKPVIFIDAGIHAREWITPPTATYSIYKLVENVTESDLLEKFDWIIFPVVNPDGYKFTFTSTRMWRKTRSTDQHSLSNICPGVDGNRNYDFFWNTVGTSNSPCTDIFAGSKPFSEIETRAVDAIIQEYRDKMILYLTMHSFGSMVLYPWGHDGSLSDNAFALHTVGIAMADAINKLKLPHFPNYIVGNSALVLNYGAAGAAEDYAHSQGIPLTYTYELPGLQSGFQGFNLDPRYIHQVCVETWAGIVAGARLAGDLYGTG